MIAFLPVGGDEEDVLVDYDLAIVNLVPNRRLGKPILNTDVAGVLKGFGHRNDGLEHYGAAARPLQGENIPSSGSSRLRGR